MIINKGAVPRDSGQISLEIVVIERLHTAQQQQQQQLPLFA